MNYERKHNTLYKYALSKRNLDPYLGDRSRFLNSSLKSYEPKQLQPVMLTPFEQSRNSPKLTNATVDLERYEKMPIDYYNKRNHSACKCRKIPGKIMTNRRNNTLSNISNTVGIRDGNNTKNRTKSIEKCVSESHMKIEYRTLLNILQKHIKMCPKLERELKSALVV